MKFVVLLLAAVPLFVRCNPEDSCSPGGADYPCYCIGEDGETYPCAD